MFQAPAVCSSYYLVTDTISSLAVLGEHDPLGGVAGAAGHSPGQAAARLQQCAFLPPSPPSDHEIFAVEVSSEHST